MKTIIITICLALSAVLSGCALRGASFTANGLNTFDGVSETYPGDSQAFAASAALELANRYPPGRTSLLLVRAPGIFGEALETALRGHGFLVTSGDTGTGITVAYIIDEVQGEVPPKAYVRMQSSDGGVFGFVRPLMGMPVVSSGAPSSMGVAAEVAPYPLPMPTFTPLISPSPSTPLLADNPKAETTPGVPVSSLHSGISLTKGILTVLPSNWKYTIPDTAKRNVRVQEPGNAPWREAVKRMSTDAGCEAQFDEMARRVTVLSVAPSLPTPPAVVPPVSSPATTPPTVASALVAFGDPVGSVEPGIPDAIHLSPIPEEEWAITPGSLHSQLMRWGEKAGYQVVWKAGHDFDMEAHATFRGTFVSAIQKLFSGMHKSGNALRVTLYQENNVLEVGDE